MKILVVGGGAREHTLVWKLSQSPRASGIYTAPGNAGTASLGTNLDINSGDIAALYQAAAGAGIDLVMVGPEVPLAAGIVDYFRGKGLPIFGPTKAAAEIEASKVFAKGLMQKHGIPCAQSVTFSDYAQAREYIQQQQPPMVIKADGLAAGKGVTVANSVPEAVDTLSNIMEAKAFGDAGNRVVVEECLFGKEMSSFAFTDGTTVVPMVSACDYKPVYDENKGPNTGGMGSYSPPFFHNSRLAKTVKETILQPAVRAMAEEGRSYQGVLYGGLMITTEGPKVIEFNARFGDPETQVVLPLLKTDLVEILLAVINGTLDKIDIEWSHDACVGVVMASGGYPGSYQTGFPISGLEDLDDDILVFHAGTKPGGEPGQVLTNGGRVLTVVARGKTIAEARDRVYTNIKRISFEGCHYRQDIALMKE